MRAAGYKESTIRFLKECATAPAPPLYYNGSVWVPIVPTISARMAVCPEKIVLEHKL
jgi:hypothetical protein